MHSNLVRFGTRRRWATEYASGWTVYDSTDGILAEGLSLADARAIVEEPTVERHEDEVQP